jgi:protease-4
MSDSQTVSSETTRQPWEREVLQGLLADNLREKRRARRWRVFLQICWLLLGLLIMLTIWSGDKSVNPEVSTKHTALVSLEGEIAAGSTSSAENIISALQSAFSEANSVAVILKINSPGGSPVQAGMINNEIRRLRTQYKHKQLYVVVEEVCASGGYYIAAAADKIFVNQASMIGSIGVMMDGFGFVGLMKNLGVERRLYTAGNHKGMLDPFTPQSEQNREYVQKMLDEIHQQFITAVRQGRGSRLKETPELFSGLVWTGQSSINLGLADGLGSIESVARDVIKTENIVDYTQREGLVDRISRRLGASIGESATRFLWKAHVH